MSLLRVEIRQIDPETDPSRVWINLPDFQVEHKSSLLFTGEVAMPAMLKALEAMGDDVDPSQYRGPYARQLEWLQKPQPGGPDLPQFVFAHEDRLYYSKQLSEDVGSQLFNCLFGPNELFACYQSVRTRSREAHEPINFQLYFAHTASDIGAQPWELLYHGNDFLCKGGAGTLTRYITYEPPPARPLPDKLNVLVISPRPADIPLIPGTELAAVRGGEQPGRLSVSCLEPPTRQSLLSYLRDRGVPQIIHFDGHGTFGRGCSACGRVTTSKKADKCACGRPLLNTTPQGYLLFEDERGGVDYVSTKDLSDLVGEAQRSDQGGVLLVVLSACLSAVARGGGSVFNGIAQGLMLHDVPMVVATQFAIESRAASKFVESFYRRIAAEAAVEKAVAGARTDLGEGKQWYRPVLYLRWRDNEGGRLIRARETRSQSAPSPKPEAVAPPAAQRDLFFLKIGENSSVEAVDMRYGAGPSRRPAEGRIGDMNLVKDINRAIDLLRMERVTGQESTVRELGEKLYRAIFAGDVQVRFESALDAVKREVDRPGVKSGQEPARWLSLVIDVAPESSAYWWPLELLYCRSDPSFPVWLAATKPILTLSRGHVPLDSSSPSEREEPPLRVLMILSNPRGDGLHGVIQADLLKELAKQAHVPGSADLTMDVKVIGRIENDEGIDGIDCLDGPAEYARIADLGSLAPGWRPQVVHFIGHGQYEQASAEGSLALEAGDRVSWCPAETVAELLQELGPRVVLLQGCQQCNPGTERALMSMADRLPRASVPAAVAMQFPMASDHATLFARAFYGALLEGNDIDQAVQFGRALVRRFTGAEYPQCFASPVLFVCNPSGIIRCRR